jgi:hypothetical protein
MTQIGNGRETGAVIFVGSLASGFQAKAIVSPAMKLPAILEIQKSRRSADALVLRHPDDARRGRHGFSPTGEYIVWNGVAIGAWGLNAFGPFATEDAAEKFADDFTDDDGEAHVVQVKNYGDTLVPMDV